jgi:hypothetical protein
MELMKIAVTEARGCAPSPNISPVMWCNWPRRTPQLLADLLDVAAGGDNPIGTEICWS